jgi:hypothetical protein
MVPWITAQTTVFYLYTCLIPAEVGSIRRIFQLSYQLRKHTFTQEEIL